MHRIGDFVPKALARPARPGPATGWAQSRRWDALDAAFPDLADMKVLDIGGDARIWSSAPIRPAHLVVLSRRHPSNEEWITAIDADPCDPDASWPDVDLIYCNSVIEHVGGHERRQVFARRIERSGASSWVQTPYRYFPVEAHFLIPGLASMPKAMQAAAIARWPIGGGATVDDRERALEMTLKIDLLSIREMTYYFPGSAIMRERVGPLVKSLVAMKTR